MLIDTHCHLSIEDYDDIDLVIKENRENGVGKIVVSACTKESILECLGYIEKYDDVYLTIGFHHSETETYTNEEIKFLRDIVKNNKKIVGIGEIGLDYHYGKDDQLKHH